VYLIPVVPPILTVDCHDERVVGDTLQGLAELTDRQACHGRMALMYQPIPTNVTAIIAK